MDTEVRWMSAPKVSFLKSWVERSGVISLALLLIGTGCSSSGSSTTADSSKGFSGTVVVPGGCSDSEAYRVDCLAMSATPSTLSGSLFCIAGETSGTFAISGLSGTPTTCSLKKVVSGVTTDYGTLMLPSSGIDGKAFASVFDTGTTSIAVSLTALGEMSISVAQDRRLASGMQTSSTIQSAPYEFSCLTQAEADSSGTVYNQTDCKCTLGDLAAAGYSKYSDCIADSGALFTMSTNRKYDLQVYKATANSAITDEASRTLVKQGETSHIVSLWEMNSGVTYRGSSGGEGLGTVGGALTFETSVPNQALSLLLGTVSVNGVRATFNTNSSNTIPTISASVDSWTSWLSQIVAGSNWSGCTWDPQGGSISSASASTLTACLAEFSQKILSTPLKSQVMPRVLLERLCTSSGCDLTLANARVKVSGFDFNYGSTWNSESQAATVAKIGNIAVSPSLRVAADQWHSYSDMSGGVHQRRTYSHWYSCKTSGGDITSSSCTGIEDGILCSIVEENGLHFLASSSIGSLNAVYTSRYSLVRSKFISANTSLDGTDATSQCTSAVGAVLPLKSASFLVKGTVSP
jgi:hypothetical protein